MSCLGVNIQQNTTTKEHRDMLTKEILEEAEFAKSHLMNSSLDDRCKKSLLRLLNTATLATNGISTEEKIQKITEAIQGLVLSQITFLDTVDKKIEKANKEQCISCKAMRHANEVEEQKEREEIIAKWKEANGYKDDEDSAADSSNKSWSQVAKDVVSKPWCWVAVIALVIAPNGVNIVKLLIDAFGAK